MKITGPLRIVVLLTAGYVTLAVFARVLAAKALYHPQMGSRQAPPGLQRIRGEAGHDVAFLYLPNASARFTIWFFHGNAEALADVEPFMRALHAAGFAVFAFDYPGYGTSGGQPSEKSIYEAARVARSHLRHDLGISAANTILFGRSLGGGPAVQMATEERVAGLVLQSTFTSVYRVLTRWPILPFDSFENQRKFARTSCPVLITHGRADEVIPFHHAETLLASAKGPKYLLAIDGAMHNDFLEVAGNRFWDALRDFSASCARTREGAP